MGKIYGFLSRWTRIDELVAPYNSQIFERVAEKNGRVMMAIAAVFGVIMLAISIGFTLATLYYGAQRIYLVALGIESHAIVTETAIETSTDKSGRKQYSTTVRYTFTTRDGEIVSDSIKRASWQVTGISQGRRIAVLYAEGRPGINIPRAGLRNNHELWFALFSALLFGLHMACFLRRYRMWRRKCCQGDAAGHLLATA